MLQFSKAIQFLTAPALPGQILAVTGAIVTVIVVFGVGAWSVIGACRVVMYLLRLHN